MNNGLRQAILISQIEAFKSAAPQMKIRPMGYLGYLFGNNKPDVLNNIIDDKSGYIKDLKIRFKKRLTTGNTSTEDDCAINATSPYFEQTISSTLFNRYSIFFEHNTIDKFTEDALAIKTIGNGNPTKVMMEVMDSMRAAMNGLLGDINIALLGAQVAAFGTNAVTASNAAKTINFQLATTSNPLNAGMTEVLSDAMFNETLMDGASIVGSGFINNYYLQQGAKSADQSGVSTPSLGLPKFYYDPYAAAAWGANQFGVFSKDAVQFINVCRFRGVKARRLGSSEFFTLTWQLVDSLGNALPPIEFDVQIREIDCPTTVEIGGESTNIGRGYVMDIMCSYQQVNIPATAYDAADPMFQNNGTLRYVATNA